MHTNWEGAIFLEECPKCKNWTLFYNPQSESKMCYSCNYKIQVKYDVYVKQSNILNLLRYPSIKTKNRTRTINL